MAEIDGLEPDTEYIVRVRTHVAGVDGAPASVVVRTGEWIPASYFWPLCISDCYPCSFHCCSVTFLCILNHPWLLSVSIHVCDLTHNPHPQH